MELIKTSENIWGRVRRCDFTLEEVGECRWGKRDYLWAGMDVVGMGCDIGYELKPDRSVPEEDE